VAEVTCVPREECRDNIEDWGLVKLGKRLDLPTGNLSVVRTSSPRLACATATFDNGRRAVTANNNADNRKRVNFIVPPFIVQYGSRAPLNAPVAFNNGRRRSGISNGKSDTPQDFGNGKRLTRG